MVKTHHVEAWEFRLRRQQQTQRRADFSDGAIPEEEI
jgi:hypothetical protein